MTSLPFPDRSKKLACDIAEFGPIDADVLLVMSSGTHGAEGYVGSAIQTAVMRTAKFDECKVAMIHAVNPWGMATRSRTDHNGIDVNRNFVDFGVAPRVNLTYDRLAPYFHVDCWNLADRRTAYAALLNRANDKALAAFAAGQFHRPDGLYWGGSGPSWSRTVLESAVPPLLAGASTVLWIDWHSGLGTYGERVVLNTARPNSTADRMARQWCGTAGGTWQDHEDLPAYNGLLIQGMKRLAPPDTLFVGLVMEFGTGDDFQVFRADCLDRYLTHEGRSDRCFSRMRDDYARAYFPTDLDWQENLLAEGERVANTALEALALVSRQ